MRSWIVSLLLLGGPPQYVNTNPGCHERAPSAPSSPDRHYDFVCEYQLSLAHCSLEGDLNCSACHGSGKAIAPARCVGCHAEVSSDLADRRGLHGKLPPADRACENCHPEHLGTGSPPVRWGLAGKAGFDHRRTGWALDAPHRAVACEGCHRPRVGPGIASGLAIRRSFSWRGLDARCGSCHPGR